MGVWEVRVGAVTPLKTSPENLLETPGSRLPGRSSLRKMLGGNQNIVPGAPMTLFGDLCVSFYLCYFF